MSGEQRKPVQLYGSGPFADGVARCLHQSGSYQLDRLSQPDEAISAKLVISVAGRQERNAIAERAVEAGARLVSLPLALPNPPSWWEDAVTAGQVTQLSDLLGYAALRRLVDQAGSADVSNTLGHRYGLFASYRLSQRNPASLAETVPSMMHYVCTVLGEIPVRVQVTMARLFGEQVDGSFALLRCADGTVATVEVAACLPDSAPVTPEILVEASGSEAMLRAEPTRQSVRVWSNHQQTGSHGWWVDPADGFTELALDAFASDAPGNSWEIDWPRLLAAIRKAADSGQPADV